MIKVNNHLGTIGISDRYLKTLVSKTAESCFGVADINRAGAVALMQGGKMALANLAGGNTETGSPEDCAAEKDYYVSMYDIVNALIGAGEV